WDSLVLFLLWQSQIDIPTVTTVSLGLFSAATAGVNELILHTGSAVDGICPGFVVGVFRDDCIRFAGEERKAIDKRLLVGVSLLIDELSGLRSIRFFPS